MSFGQPRNVRKSTVLKEHVQKMENVSWRVPYLNVFVNLDLLVRNVTMISMNASQIHVSINVKTQGIIDFVTRGKSKFYIIITGKFFYSLKVVISDDCIFSDYKIAKQLECEQDVE